MANTHPWIILFDIDGTLLTVDSNFNRKHMRELLDKLGIDYPNMEKDSFSGRTDHDIFTSFLVNHDFDDGLYQEFKVTYLKSLEQKLDPEHVTRHAFVDEAISYFSNKNFITGLLTGNYPPAATIKLKAADINADFSFGAFGEFERDRNKLPGIAIKQVENLYGFEANPSRFVIIGDTPRDITCAQKAGMKCVSVTTGKFSHEELADYNPDLILEDLSSPEIWFQQLINDDF